MRLTQKSLDLLENLRKLFEDTESSGGMLSVQGSAVHHDTIGPYAVPVNGPTGTYLFAIKAVLGKEKTS